MDDRYIAYFLRVAELGSINRAAAELNLSQPALSRHIASLEHEFGAPLFSRARSGVQLTEAGRLLAERARPVLRQLEALKQQVGESAVGQLAIGVPIAWQTIFSPDYCAQFIRQNGGSRLRYYEVVSQVLRDYMLSGLLDLAILPVEALPARGYTQTPLLKEGLVYVTNGRSGIEHEKPVSPNILDGKTFVLASRSNFMRHIVDQALAKRHLRIECVIEANTLGLSFELVAQGIADCVMPSSAISLLKPGVPYRWAPIRGLSMSWVLWESQARAHAQLVQRAKRLVLSTVKSKLDAGKWKYAEALRP